MIISELRVYDFRQFKSVDGAPGLKITFHKGLNALIGENDSGKTAVIDALKLVLLTQSNEYIRPSDEDFYKPVGEDACSEFKIDCTISDFTQNEAKNFIEYLSFNQTENGIEYTLELHYRACIRCQGDHAQRCSNSRAGSYPSRARSSGNTGLVWGLFSASNKSASKIGSSTAPGSR